MYESLHEFPHIAQLVNALERRVFRPGRAARDRGKRAMARRGLSPKILLLQTGSNYDPNSDTNSDPNTDTGAGTDTGRQGAAERLAWGIISGLSRSDLVRFPYAVIREPKQDRTQAEGPAVPEPVDRVGPRAVLDQVRDGLTDHRPGGFGRVRFRQYELIRSVVTAPPATESSDVASQGAHLRTHYYQQRRARRSSRAREALLDQQDIGKGLFGWTHSTISRLLQWLPLIGNATLVTGRITREGGWYWQWAERDRGKGDFFERSKVTGTLAGALNSRAHQDEEKRYAAEQALLCALLADLDAATRPWFSHWARLRREYRYVIVAPGPAEPGSRIGRLLEQFPDAVRHTGSRNVVLIAVRDGDPDAGLSFPDAVKEFERLDRPDDVSGPPLSTISRTIQVRVRDGLELPREHENDRQWLHQHSDAVNRLKDRSNWRPRLLTGVEVVGCTAVLAAASIGPVTVWGSAPSTVCLDRASGTLAASRSKNVAADGDVGDSSGAAGGVKQPADASPDELHKEALGLIEQQNAKVAKEAAAGNPVRTVVYLGAPMGLNNWGNAAYSGAIPELRGIALSQIALNEEAATDAKGNKVWLRVEVRNAGDRFTKAPTVARDIVERTRKETAKGEESDQIMGVVGLGQSREPTIEAQSILGAAGIPMIGTVATAENMLRQEMYRQVAPDNGREAQIAADFAHRGNIVEISQEPKRCAPAKRAVIIKDPTDLYSANLADRFKGYFRASDVLQYSTGEPVDTAPAQQRKDVEWVQSLDEMATEVCERIEAEPRTVVYWAGRANEFEGFLDEFDSGTDCEGRVSVLGGDDLTNAAVARQRPSQNHPKARLYYAAHALPTLYPPNVMAEKFSNQYAAAFGERDLWINDGRAPLSWDALRVLGSAVNAARTAAGSADFGRGTVQAILENGVEGKSGIRGATGQLRYTGANYPGPAAERPDNKRLLILRDTEKGPQVALECGLLDSKVEERHWGPGGAYGCPRDAGSEPTE